ncbi:MAG: hypothetical protein ABJF10_02405 [Chthoniobacter sp.]|uniref:hypothetical protein n=1 Tax=Chthoniobacter sp. TaxID=2510640 RepID=UPI0032A26F67
MNADAAFRNDLVDLADPNLAGIVDFPGATSDESAIVNGEHDGIEQLQVLPIKWAVDEDAQVIFAGRERHGPLRLSLCPGANAMAVALDGDFSRFRIPADRTHGIRHRAARQRPHMF